MLADDRRSWQLGPDAALAADRGDHRGPPGTHDTFEALMEDAARRSSAAATTLPPAPTTGSLGRRTAAGSDGPASTTDAEARVEIELKYRITDVAAGERLLAADELAGFTASGPRARSRTRIATWTRRTARWPAPGYAVRLRTSARGRTVIGSSRSRQQAPGRCHRREELEGPADRIAEPLTWPRVGRPRR